MMSFNWDNINCASPNLENSGYFFSIRHVEHEKHWKDCEKAPEENEDCKENLAPCSEVIQNVVEEKEKEKVLEKNKKAENQKENKITKKVPLKTRVNLQNASSKNYLKIPKTVPKIEIPKIQQKIGDIKRDKKPLTSRIVQSRTVQQPKVQKDVKIDSKKVKEFRAKPAPNFKRLHEQQKKQVKRQPTVTIPQTPTVLRKSQMQKSENKKEVKKTFRNPIKQPAFKTVPAVPALKREPFRPKKEVKTTLVIPFNFQTRQRHEDRLRYDDIMRQMRELKIQQKLNEKRKQEEDLRKQLRKKTEFKARPNPFK
ncbi:targeting protein for Xklp2 homolog [Phlebotomus papatasi]|uniref:targeting protein for Xklp2 homolog n=1 Tax=Phlebotomus papatasi TaxID=29031 RepID=UPI0024835F9D|nr:targeting protein for Xklp2 homolog [Phlebotomus papatasi]